MFFTLIFILKSFLAWGVIFGDLLSWKSLITEIPFIWALFCLIEAFASKRKLGLYMLVNLLVTAIFFAAIMYFKYYGVIVTYQAAEQVNQVTAVRNSVFSLMDPYYLLIFSDIIIFGIYFFFNKKGRSYKKKTSTAAAAIPDSPTACCSRYRLVSACSMSCLIRPA